MSDARRHMTSGVQTNMQEIISCSFAFFDSRMFLPRELQLRSAQYHDIFARRNAELSHTEAVLHHMICMLPSNTT